MSDTIQLVLAGVGALYTLFTVIGNLAKPGSKLARFCQVTALVLRKVPGADNK